MMQMLEKARQLFFRVEARLGMVFLVFLTLLVVSGGVTFYGLEVQKLDARIINLAGRQRMLLQQMSSQAIGYTLANDRGDFYQESIRDSTAAFDKTLNALINGGTISDYTGAEIAIAVPQNPDLLSALLALQTDWAFFETKINDLFKAHDAPQKGVIVREIETMVPGMVDRADYIVRIFEEITHQKLTRLRVYEVLFLSTGVIVLFLGWMISSKSIVQPLERLTQAAREIGNGQLAEEIAVEGSFETHLLSQTMDQMRTQILASQSDLKNWAETLEERVLQRTRELEALSSVSQEITSHLSIGEVLNSVAVKARELSGADIAAICLLDEDGKILHLNAVDGQHETVQQMQSSALNLIAGQVLHPASTQPCDLQSCNGACQILDERYLNSHIAVSLRSKGKIIGALCIGSQKAKAFDLEVKTLLSQLGSVTEIALENSRLYQQAESYATLEERQRLASEMHDGSLQTLSFLKLVTRLAMEQLQKGEVEKAAYSLQQIERAEDQAEHEIRGAIVSLQDVFPKKYTLQELLVELAGELSKNAPDVEFISHTLQPIILERQESEQALRIVREAIINAQKHSHSERILVTLLFDAESRLIKLQIKDFGVGFHPQSMAFNGRAHFGLQIMHARAARLGGQVEIHSAKNSGTEVIFYWRPSSLILGKGM